MCRNSNFFSISKYFQIFSPQKNKKQKIRDFFKKCTQNNIEQKLDEYRNIPENSKFFLKNFRWTNFGTKNNAQIPNPCVFQ